MNSIYPLSFDTNNVITINYCSYTTGCVWELDMLITIDHMLLKLYL